MPKRVILMESFCKTMRPLAFLAAMIIFEIVKQDVTCGFTNNGVIAFKNLNGGAAPLGYSINNGSSYRTDPMFTNRHSPHTFLFGEGFTF
jgi:hypothetical protein